MSRSEWRPFLLTKELLFPHPGLASPEGLLAIGGDLSPERLVLAYSNGIFPWPHGDLPLLWFSPDPRMVLTVEGQRISRRMGRTLRSGRYQVTLDRDFDAVIRSCATIPRGLENGTWINDEMIRAYRKLFDLGIAHSVETWMDGELVGGLYGISLGAAFFGESMFSKERDGSKVALFTLSGQLARWGFHFIDCQVPTPHLASLGAEPWPRSVFLKKLAAAMRRPTHRGRWALEG